MNKKRILLICTGGTIASTLKKDGYWYMTSRKNVLKYSVATLGAVALGVVATTATAKIAVAVIIYLKIDFI